MSFNPNFPLKGKTIVVTRAEGQQAEAKERFNAIGANVLDLPALKIGPPDDWHPLDSALNKLDEFDWLIFSSINGVKAVEERLQLIGMNLACRPNSLKIASVGKKTAKALMNIGVQTDFTPPDFVADSLIQHFPAYRAGVKVLLPRVQSGGRTVLADAFLGAGLTVVEVAAYESDCPDVIPEDTLDAIDKSKVDAVVFTSGKTALHTSLLLEKSFGPRWMDKLNAIKLISIGPQTSLSCKKYFARVDKEANPHDLDGLIFACINLFSNLI